MTNGNQKMHQYICHCVNKALLNMDDFLKSKKVFGKQQTYTNADLIKHSHLRFDDLIQYKYVHTNILTFTHCS